MLVAYAQIHRAADVPEDQPLALGERVTIDEDTHTQYRVVDIAGHGPYAMIRVEPVTEEPSTDG